MLMERGAPTPGWLEEQPQQESGDGFYLQSFWELSTERQLGFTVGPIPESAIRMYGGAHHLSPVMMVVFKAVIRSMDSTYRDWAESERKKAQKGNDKRGSKQSYIGDNKQVQDK